MLMYVCYEPSQHVCLDVGTVIQRPTVHVSGELTPGHTWRASLMDQNTFLLHRRLCREVPKLSPSSQKDRWGLRAAETHGPSDRRTRLRVQPHQLREQRRVRVSCPDEGVQRARMVKPRA